MSSTLVKKTQIKQGSVFVDTSNEGKIGYEAWTSVDGVQLTGFLELTAIETEHEKIWIKGFFPGATQAITRFPQFPHTA